MLHTFIHQFDKLNLFRWREGKNSEPAIVKSLLLISVSRTINLKATSASQLNRRHPFVSP